MYCPIAQTIMSILFGNVHLKGSKQHLTGKGCTKEVRTYTYTYTACPIGMCSPDNFGQQIKLTNWFTNAWTSSKNLLHGIQLLASNRETICIHEHQ